MQKRSSFIYFGKRDRIKNEQQPKKIMKREKILKRQEYFLKNYFKIQKK